MVILNIEPVTKPRMTRRDQWLKPPRPEVARYWAFSDHLKAILGDFELPAAFQITSFVPVPASWSRKKEEEMDGQPHQSRPDLDNLLKAFMDATCEKDDYIYDVRAAKFWTNGEGIIEVQTNE